MNETFKPRPFAPPPGGKEVTGGQFLNFEPGQSAEGMLIGTTPIRNQRAELIDRYVLIDALGETHILPDHVDLVRKLADVVLKTGWGAQVWIGFHGKEKVEGVANPLAKYLVHDYGLTESGKVLAQRYREAKAGVSEEEPEPF